MESERPSIEDTALRDYVWPTLQPLEQLRAWAVGILQFTRRLLLGALMGLIFGAILAALLLIGIAIGGGYIGLPLVIIQLLEIVGFLVGFGIPMSLLAILLKPQRDVLLILSNENLIVLRGKRLGQFSHSVQSGKKISFDVLKFPLSELPKIRLRNFRFKRVVSIQSSAGKIKAQFVPISPFKESYKQAGEICAAIESISH